MPPNQNDPPQNNQADSSASNLKPVRPLKIPLIQVSSSPHISITDTPTPTPSPADAGASGSRAIAVALKHELNDTPKVVASGYGKTAEKILQLAYESGVKVRQDGDLAQILAAIEIDSPIPLSCFDAVAEILNYLYRLNATPPQFLR
ncbi:MAG: EscU/YscU/HrcU family type III secretion system export apparatus switch protein [Candidatus Symbiobacter sp.]|nr:EscU/YscU/HrcU family type III secretion system export apparatus switch protein [Candidatus Symbiobacter sp.]